MSRFFVDAKAILDNSIRITDADDRKHILKVLRLGIGDIISVSDSAEFEYKAEIISSEKDFIEAKILDKQKFAGEPELKITLFQGIPKKGKMETIIQKTVELGVFSVVPVFTDRTVVIDHGNFNKKIERWQKISDEAVKQCRRGIIPQIRQQISFKEMLEVITNYDLILFPYENEKNLTIKSCLRMITEKPKDIAVIIGPEGGFSDNEANILIKNGACSVSLGKTVLRTETAGMAAIAMIMYELEL
ncbi:MAG: RsmE family RNA methyltransferase [Eubacteriales bacterium]|nr:RsmE family RNA methyltransferase [Eubacteriales bacterium]MDD3199624.1 RsmE family RNA methyltransferase [Eubacteriales bacterium]MDD4629891.1 RsmE family RNA methyltransferase [Eubacteriales bacterium]